MSEKKPTFFTKQSDFRKWLMKNHSEESELLVGFYKATSGKASITWPQSVDEALCFGWIDGVRKSLGDESYTIRFTPRKATSNWSAINIKKVEELTKSGLMQPAGLESFKKRKEEKSRIYSYENQPEAFDKASEKIFKANKKAWKYFQSQAPWYQKTIRFWVMSAKQNETRTKRLQKLIAACEEGKRLL